MFKISVSTAVGGIKLSNRSEKLGYSINVVSSYLLNSTIGVPRWSILGPILFLIYINDLPFCSTLLAILFADDTTLLASGDNIEELILLYM